MSDVKMSREEFINVAAVSAMMSNPGMSSEAARRDAESLYQARTEFERRSEIAATEAAQRVEADRQAAATKAAQDEDAKLAKMSLGDRAVYLASVGRIVLPDQRAGSIGMPGSSYPPVSH